MTDNTKQDEASRLAELIDEYWSIAYQQGLVHASHDDEQGSAGLCLHKINASIAALSKQQAPEPAQDGGERTALAELVAVNDLEDEVTRLACGPSGNGGMERYLEAQAEFDRRYPLAWAAARAALAIPPHPPAQPDAPATQVAALTDEQIDAIFDAHNEAPTMAYRYLVARAILSEAGKPDAVCDLCGGTGVTDIGWISSISCPKCARAIEAGTAKGET